MNQLHDMAAGLRQAAAGLVTTMKRARGSNRKGGFSSMRAPWGTDAFNVEFVLQASACLDWHALAPWMNAADARIGATLPAAVYKLHVLASWFGLDGEQLERACARRSDFRRFVGAPLHGPMVEMRLYREHERRFERARPALAKLSAAVELQLVEHGFFPPTEVLSRLDPDLGLAAPVESTQLLSSAPRPVASGMQRTTFEHAQPVAAPRQAVLVWPWGEITAVDRRIRIGRDIAYSDVARHVGADRKVSRKHAVIEPAAGGILVQDLGSSNGTYVDDMLLPHSGGRVVTDDAVIRFGTDLSAMLVFDDSPPTAKLRAS